MCTDFDVCSVHMMDLPNVLFKLDMYNNLLR